MGRGDDDMGMTLILSAPPHQRTPGATRAVAEADAAGEFARAYAAHYAPLCAFAARLVRPRAMAEDLVQDVFAALWTRSHTIRDQDLLTSYLYSAVRNRARSHLRHQQVVLRTLAAPAPPAPPAAPALDDELHATELQAAVLAAVSSLPARCREIFLLQRHEGLSYAEIAARLGISVKTVETQMSRALRALRLHLAPFMS